VIGCEVESVEEGIGLTEAVAGAVPRAIDAVKEVVAGLRTRSPAASVERQG
jgi:hydrogenase maturation protease